jgi:hypothetical protein
MLLGNDKVCIYAHTPAEVLVAFIPSESMIEYDVCMYVMIYDIIYYDTLH